MFLSDFAQSIRNLVIAIVTLKRFFFFDIKIVFSDVYQADQMVENIREAFIDNLKSVNWMDEKTKQAAEEKVRLKRLHVLKQSLNILSCNMF